MAYSVILIKCHNHGFLLVAALRVFHRGNFRVPCPSFALHRSRFVLQGLTSSNLWMTFTACFLAHTSNPPGHCLPKACGTIGSECVIGIDSGCQSCLPP